MNSIIGRLDESYIPATSQEWFAWLSNEEEKSRKSFLSKPSRLISDYNAENAYTRDYEGREILETLQNAADQARDADVRGEVVIDLVEEGLIVANSGASFSIGGVASLETAHLSPKRRKRRKYIGNKGLGFRSVLNWSRSPIILSGELRLAYSKLVSSDVLKGLMQESDELAELVLDEQDETSDLVIPLLTFPGFNNSGELSHIVTEPNARKILSRCEAWIEAGYTTAIGMPFDRPNSYIEAQIQLEELRPEILLFVDHLDELRFVNEENGDRIWKQESSGRTSLVMENGEPIGLWDIYRKDDELPKEAMDPDQRGPLGYEIVVAVPDAEDKQPSELFSYFPTEVTLPLPIVCHVTLDLDQSRKHPLQKRKSNRYVLDRLADFVAEVAEMHAVNHQDGPNAGFRLIFPLGDYPHELKREGFTEKLIGAAKKRAIVPTLGGQAARPADACLVEGADAKWLPVKDFCEVVPVSDLEETHFFESLGVQELGSSSLRSRLIALISLSVSERGALITGLLENGISEEVCTSSLLIDNEGNQIPDGMRVFLSPTSGVAPNLPKWMDLRFLSDALRSDLSDRLDVRDARHLQGKISDFGVVEYSLSNLVSALIAAANRQKKNHPDQVKELNRDLLIMIFNLFQAEGESHKRPEYPDKAPLPILNQKGNYVRADRLYFGRGYGAHENVTQALYGTWAPEKLIAEPKQLDLIDDESTLREYLSWLGVSVWPRVSIEKKPKMAYLHYILNQIEYPAKFEDYHFGSQKKIERPSLENVGSVDGLDEILKHANPIAIVSWLGLDDRAIGWGRMQEDHADLCARPGQTQYNRVYRKPVPSYLRWKIEHSVWLPTQDGSMQRPMDCVLGTRAIERLFPRPAMPDNHSLTLYAVTNYDIREGWRHSGVLLSLADLDMGDIYARLLDLPNRDPEGKSSRSLYHWLLDAADAAMGDGAAMREIFVKEGQMWGNYGEISGYFPVRELRHVDSEGLPSALIERLKVVALRKRIGAEKVERVFGIRAIGRDDFEKSIKNTQLAVGSAEAAESFQSVKPYFYKLRASQTSHTQFLRELKELSLQVCSELRATIRYEDEELDYALPVWGWIVENQTLYIRSDPAEPLAISSDLLADSVGEAIASLLRIADGGDYARMFICKEKNRRTLLRKLGGEAADEDIDAIISEFGLPSEDRVSGLIPDDTKIEEPLEIPSNHNVGNTPEDSDVGNEVTSSLADGLSSGELQIQEKEHKPSDTPNRQGLRIQKTRTGGVSNVSGRNVTDGAFCEKKAMEFEKNDEPSRFPLLVGQITGHQGVGCDVLSFDSAVDRDDFASGANRDYGNVLRYIEVKGRSRESGAIELKGNERVAAEKYRDRYYIYRLCESSAGEYQLSILQNPLRQEDALEPVVHVDLNRASATQRFTLTGGVLRR